MKTTQKKPGLKVRGDAPPDIANEPGLFRSLLDHSSDAVEIIDPATGRFLDVNDTECRVLGYSRQELLGMRIFDIDPKLRRKNFKQIIERLRSEDSMIFETTHQKRDGSFYPVEVSAKLVQGGREYVLSMARDISERKKAEQALLQSEVRFRALVKQSSDAVILVDKNNQVVYYAGPQKNILGYTAEEMVGQFANELTHPDDEEYAAEQRRKLFATPGLILTWEHRIRHKNGSWVWLESVAHNLLNEPSVQAIVIHSRDISERKESEAHILRLNRLYATLSQINEVIVRTRERGALLSEICRVVIDEGKFRMAWIGLIDPQDEKVKPVVSAGEERGYLHNLSITYRKKREGRGPTGTAIREGRTIICQDIAIDKRMAPWRDAALERGYRSSAAVPIREHGGVIGALTVYSAELHGFDFDIERLLDEIGQDISFALDSIDAENERQQAEEALRHNEARYRALIEHSWDGLTLVDREFKVLYASPVNERIIGYASEQREGKNAVDLIHPDDAKSVLGHLETVAKQSGAVERIEYRVRAKNGEWKWIESIAHNLLDEPGIEAIVANFRDISARKQADEQLRLQKALLESASEASPDGIAIISKERKWLHHNQRFIEMWGIDPDLADRGDSRQTAEMTAGSVVNPAEFVANINYLYENLDISQQDEVHFSDGRIFDRYTGPVWAANGKIYGRIWHCRDITERRHAEEALRASESRWRAVFDHAGIGIALLDDAGRPFQNNVALQQMLGYNAADLSEMSFAEFTHPDDVDTDMTLFRELAEGKRERYQIEKRYVRKDGETIWANLTATMLHDEKGNRQIGLGMAEDITQRKRAEEALRANESWFRALIENSRDMVRVIDGNGKTIYSSPSAERIMGYPTEEVLGKSVFDLVHPDDRSGVMESWQRTLTTNGPQPGTVEARIRHADGTWHVHEAIGTNLLDNPDVRGFVMNSRDISDRKQAEETLREARSFLQLVVDSSPSMIFVLDAEGRLVFANQYIADYYGTSPEELIAKSTREIHEAQDEADDFMNDDKRVLRTKQKVVRDEINTGPSGERHWFHTVKVPLIKPDGSVNVLGIATDITDRKQAEEKIQRQLDHLSALSEIDRSITSSFDVRQSLDTLLSHLGRQLNVDATEVLLFDAEAQMLEHAAGQGFRRPMTSSVPMHIGQGYAGQVILERQIVIIPNLKDQPVDPSRGSLFANEHFVSYCGVPLIAKGQIRGVLEIFQRSRLEPDKDWIDFLKALAGQAAIAIENATLFSNLQRSNSELSIAYDATIEGWSRALDLRDRETEGHTRRVTDLTIELGRALHLRETELVQMRWGALLHDIGKMGVPDGILFKPGPLIDEEWAIMKKHPTFAYEMLSPIRYLQGALDIPYLHHEKWDGTGYPLGLRGEQIPLAARIFAVVDVWDALRSDRPYRPAWSLEKARDHILSLKGTHFDPYMVDVFLESSLIGK